MTGNQTSITVQAWLAAIAVILLVEAAAWLFRKGWKMTGYECHNRGVGYSRAEGDYLIQVGTVGLGFMAAWGYTVWLDGRCVAGACDWDWDTERARAAAERCCAELPRPDPGIRENPSGPA